MTIHRVDDRNRADERRRGGEDTEEEWRSPLENLKTRTPLNMANLSGVETLCRVERPPRLRPTEVSDKNL